MRVIELFPAIFSIIGTASYMVMRLLRRRQRTESNLEHVDRLLSESEQIDEKIARLTK